MSRIRFRSLALLLIFVAVTFAVSFHFHSPKEAPNCQLCQVAHMSVQQPRTISVAVEFTYIGILASFDVPVLPLSHSDSVSFRAPPLS